MLICIFHSFTNSIQRPFRYFLFFSLFYDCDFLFSSPSGEQIIGLQSQSLCILIVNSALLYVYFFNSPTITLCSLFSQALFSFPYTDAFIFPAEFPFWKVHLPLLCIRLAYAKRERKSALFDQSFFSVSAAAVWFSSCVSSRLRIW